MRGPAPRSRNFEIDRGFGKSAEEIAVSYESADQRGQKPKQKHPQIPPAENVRARLLRMSRDDKFSPDAARASDDWSAANLCIGRHECKHGHTDAMIYIARMNITSATEVKYLKGVGPQRAGVFASRGIHSVGDLLLYLPFRYEDRIRFNHIAEIAPGGTYTVHGTVARPRWYVLRAAEEPFSIC